MPAYKKVDGRVLLNCGETIVPCTHNEKDHAKKRNHAGRIFLKNGEAFQNIVKVGRKTYVVAEGVAKATPLKRCSLLIRTRAERNVKEPPAPTPPEDI